VIASHQIEVVIIVDLQLIGTLMLVAHHLHIVLELGVDVVPRVWHLHLAWVIIENELLSGAMLLRIICLSTTTMSIRVQKMA
tara:strand:- start:335 stop:580 length:246 start_codon:yes stop_codon:yes gene_type:complete